MSSPSSSLVWTVLPNGIYKSHGNVEKKLKLSILISPKIQTNNIAAIPKSSNLFDWPSKVKEIIKTIKISFGDRLIDTELDCPIENIDSNLWKHIFIASSCLVKSFANTQESEKNKQFYPYKVQPTLKAIKDHYQNIGKISPTAPPTLKGFLTQKPLISSTFLPLFNINPILPVVHPPTNVRSHANKLVARSSISIAEVRSNIIKALKMDTPHVEEHLKKNKDWIMTKIPKLFLDENNNNIKLRSVSTQRIEKSFEDHSHVAHLYLAKSFLEQNESAKTHTGPQTASWDSKGSKNQEILKRFENQYDFHQVIHLLSHYPEILRRLGLLIDVVVPAVHVPLSNVPHPLSIAIKSEKLSSNVDEHHNNYIDKIAKTFYIYDGDETFAAAPRENDNTNTKISKGMLSFEDDKSYTFHNLDVDKAAFNFLSTIQNEPPIENEDSLEREFAFPTLRTGGLSVSKKDLCDDLSNRMDRNDKILSSQDYEGLWAQDLVAGYRIDIWDNKSKKWHSLCFRNGTYYKHDGESNEKTEYLKHNDEGWIQPAVTTSLTASSNTDNYNYLHESLFHWFGWSLCVRRPGKQIDPSDSYSANQNEPLTKIKFSVNFLPKEKSLSRLRFGRVYRARARVVDISGNSISLDEANDINATPETKFYRFEAVSSPLVILKKEITPSQNPGESLRTIVIRTHNDSIDKDNIVIDDFAERHIVPPKTTQLIAELNGMFDEIDKEVLQKYLNPNTRNLAEAIYKLILERDPPKSGENDNNTDFEVFPPLPKDKSKSTSQEHYPIDRNEQAKIKYMPDPFCVGSSICNLPGVAPAVQFDGSISKHLIVGEIQNHDKLVYTEQQVDQISLANNPNATLIRSVTKIDFGDMKKWPEMSSYKIKLIENTTKDDLKPSWDSSRRTLTVRIPKGELHHIRLSSYLQSDTDLSKLGIWHWISENNEEILKLKEYSINGLHHLITPSIKVTLVHAVQQPLGLPEIKAMINHCKSRFIDDSEKLYFNSLKLYFNIDGGGVGYDPNLYDSTFYPLDGIIKVHSKSTLKIDLMASWSEPYDDGNNSNPLEEEKHYSNRAFEIQIPYTSEDMVEFFEFQYFPSNKYRKVTYTAVATSRYKEYFITGAQDGSSDNNNKFTRQSNPFTLHLVNKLTPSPLKIVQTIPIFRWEGGHPVTNMTNITSKRIGNAVRIYFKRPCGETGANELMGVLLLENSSLKPDESPFDDKFENCNTLLGEDVIWSSENIQKVPDVNQFRNVATVPIVEADQSLAKEQKAILKGISLPSNSKFVDPKDKKKDLRDYKFTVIGHKINFDQKRNLYYSDIEIDMSNHKTYNPFIRFAIVRFQPNSDVGKHISDVSITDFVQLQSDRIVEVIKDRSVHGSDVRNIVVKGISYTNRRGISIDPVNHKPRIDTTLAENSKMILKIERLKPKLGDFGWEQIPDIKIKEENDKKNSILWKGNVEVPPKQSDSDKLRLVIKEYETFMTESSNYTEYLNEETTILMRLDIDVNGKKMHEVGRLVYFDTIDLG